MKLLYLSCHSILEYDELKLFTELGIDWFSLGSYINPKTPHDPKRPGIDAPVKEHFMEIDIQFSKDNLSPELVAWADVIMVMHKTEWITQNLAKLEGKKVVWRTIGQSVAWTERDLEGYRNMLRIVRCSPKEMSIPSYLGAEAFIRFYKDPEEFRDWNGNNPRLVSFVQSPQQRSVFCRSDILEGIMSEFPSDLYGTDTEAVPVIGRGRTSYEDQKKILQDARVYLYTGTYPASYTLSFIEAMMTGIPIVAIGSDLANPSDHISHFQNQRTYEIEDIIKNGVNGYISNDINELKQYIQALLENKELAQKIGEEGRKTAIELFGKETIKQQWKKFFETI